MPIRKTDLPDDSQQVNIRLGQPEITRAEEIAEAEEVTRSDVLRSCILDGLDTYETEGALLPPEIQKRVEEAADDAGLGELEALREAVECWLRTREVLADATKPMRFPPRHVAQARKQRADWAREMLGTE